MENPLPERNAGNLQGSLELTNITDIIQVLHRNAKSGQLRLDNSPGGDVAEVYFLRGDLVHAALNNMVGLEALIELVGWETGEFQFFPNVLSPTTSINLPVEHALMEAVRMCDERQNAKHSRRSNKMEQKARTSTDVLEDLLDIPGVDATVVAGRDGFVIESVGRSTRVNIDELGAALAHSISGVEEMGKELNINAFQDLFIEYGSAVLICRPVGDAVSVIITPDASKLGIIRYKSKNLFKELANFF